MRNWLGRGWAICLWFSVLSSAPSCSLSNIDQFTDGVCPADTKACNGRCVSDTEPSVGCRVPGCTPCDFPNAAALCLASGTCAMGACATNYADCNGMASDGCEADTKHDPTNCGQCGCTCGTGDATRCGTNQHVEPIPHGAPGCSGGLCAIGSCDPGWGDCNGILSDGCETPVDTNENCGVCGMTCDRSLKCTCSMQDGQTGCSCDWLDASPE